MRGLAAELDKNPSHVEPRRVQQAHPSPLVGGLSHRHLVAVMAAVLQVAPVNTVAAEPAAPSTDSSNLDRARQLHEKAQTRYEMFDYNGAIESWMEAYGLLRNDDAARGIRNAIVWNIATAQIKAYEVDKNVQHLHQGLMLLRKYMKEYVEIHGDTATDDEETVKIRARVDELQTLIEAAEPDEPAPDAPFPPASGSQSGGEAAPAERPGKDRKVGPLSYAGFGALAVGLGGIGLMAYGMSRASTWQQRYEDFPADRERIASEGRTANAMSVAGGVAGGVLLAAGVTLLVVDQLLRKKGKGPWARKGDAARVGPQMRLRGSGWEVVF